MSEHPNIGLLRKGYGAFEKGDLATLTQLFADDIVWHLSGTGPLSGEHRGREAVFAIFGQLAQLSGGTFRLDLHSFLAEDEHTVALSRVTGSRQGKQLNSLAVDVHHVRDGKFTEFWSFFADQRAFDEFWS